MKQNQSLSNFVKLTLKNNPDNQISLKGKQFLAIIQSIRQEDSKQYKELILETINDEITKCTYNTSMAQWLNTDLETQIFDKLKQKLYIDLQEKFKNLKF